MTLPPEAFDRQVEKAHQKLKMIFEDEPIDPIETHEEKWYDTPSSYAHALIDMAYESGYASGKSHETMAAAAYYGTRLMWNRKMTQDEVADLSGVSKQVIAKHYDPMLQLLYPELRE